MSRFTEKFIDVFNLARHRRDGAIPDNLQIAREFRNNVNEILNNLGIDSLGYFVGGAKELNALATENHLDSIGIVSFKQGEFGAVEVKVTGNINRDMVVVSLKPEMMGKHSEILQLIFNASTEEYKKEMFKRADDGFSKW